MTARDWLKVVLLTPLVALWLYVLIVAVLLTGGAPLGGR